MAVHHFLLTLFAIHRYLLFPATTIRRIPQQQVLRGSIESKAYLSYAADSVGAQLTPLTQLVGPKNLRCALVVVYVLFFQYNSSNSTTASVLLSDRIEAQALACGRLSRSSVRSVHSVDRGRPMRSALGR